MCEEARKYKTITEFKFGSPGAYNWAVRNGVAEEVTAFMYEIKEPDVCCARSRASLAPPLATPRRHTTSGTTSHPSSLVTSDDPELISEGTYMDFEAQMFDQAAIERSDGRWITSSSCRNTARQSR